MRYALLCVLLLGCTVRQVTPPRTLDAARLQIVKRDVTFVYDSIPTLRFSPPFAYGAIRLQVERCSGLTREGWPRFYIAQDNPLPGFVLAFYDEDRKAVVFALGNETVPSTVAHELLHYLLAPHIPSKKRSDESFTEYTARVHPDSIFNTDTGKCRMFLNPGH